MKHFALATRQAKSRRTQLETQALLLRGLIVVWCFSLIGAFGVAMMAVRAFW